MSRWAAPWHGHRWHRAQTAAATLWAQAAPCPPPTRGWCPPHRLPPAAPPAHRAACPPASPACITCRTPSLQHRLPRALTRSRHLVWCRQVSAALATLFEAMNEIGTWDKGMPIFLSRGKGNDVGNAFVFAPDMLATLLESLPADAFRPHMGAVSRHVDWLQQNQVGLRAATEPALTFHPSVHLQRNPTRVNPTSVTLPLARSTSSSLSRPR